MEKYLVPVNPSKEKPRPINRHRWKRSLIELNGSFEPNYQHCMSGIIMQSYSQFQGVYLASVAKSGCLTVHDFDSIHGPDLEEDKAKQLLYIYTGERLDVVRWNLAIQDEVACTTIESIAVRIFDVGYVSSVPVDGRANTLIQFWHLWQYPDHQTCIFA